MGPPLLACTKAGGASATLTVSQYSTGWAYRLETEETTRTTQAICDVEALVRFQRILKRCDKEFELSGKDKVAPDIA